MRNSPAAAAELAADGHDACFITRSRHFTGDVGIRDVAFAGDEVWITSTEFSCLATLDAAHNRTALEAAVHRRALAPGDRCHLDGLCVVDDHPRWVTALGVTDRPDGWRACKVDGGVLISVDCGETVVGELDAALAARWRRSLVAAQSRDLGPAVRKPDPRQEPRDVRAPISRARLALAERAGVRRRLRDPG